MLISKLTNEYINSIENSLLPKLINKSPIETFCFGITDSAKGFFLSALFESKKINRTIVYLAPDPSSAFNIYHEILNISSIPVYFFCGHEVSPYDQISSDPDILSYQTNTILRLIRKKEPCLIISHGKYLLEKIWNKNDLLNNLFYVNQDTVIEPEKIANEAIKLGYKKVTTVTTKGEFSIRGDILDIYPIIGEPTRVNFFGDQIESIKSYSIRTQRSEESANSLTLTPRFFVINPDIKKIEDFLNKSKGNSLAEIVEKEISEITSNNYCESIEYYSQIINQRQSSILDYIPEDTLFMTDDWEANVISIESWEKRNEDIKKELEKSGKIIPLPDSLIISKENVISNIKKYSRCYLERFEPFDEKNPGSLDLHLTPSERFSNQIEQFVEKIRLWLNEKNKIIIFSDQPQRVNGLLKEWEIPSVLIENIKEEDFPEKQIIISGGGTVNGFKIPLSKIIVLTDQEIFGTKRKTKFVHEKRESKSDKHQYYSNIEDLKINDFVVHIKHGIGRYRGLVKITVENNEREYLMVEYASEGKLYLPVEQINFLYRYRGANDVVPKLSKLGGSDWELTKKKVKKAVKRIAQDLLNLYTARSKQEGYAFNKDSHWQIEMEEAFLYTETPDQWKAIKEVKNQMESTKPMDILVCGDVGYGKTEVALRAVFKAVLSGKQVAVLVPTTILAQQHFNVISERLAAYPVRITLLSRFRTPKEQKIAIGKLSLGEIDIVIGTHRLLQKDVKFKDLGLVVIDEEQRFGVIHKEKLKQLRVSVDVLTLSATPIPRTLYMALSGARDMSLINTPPTNRLPIKTYVGEYKSTIVKTAILHEIERGGQIYFVHNRVESIYNVATELKELVPEANIAVAHGQLNDKDLESIMYDFSVKKYNVLVCTTIIESGIDIPSVNTIVVDNADHFGLAQLYQLRGRVGRTNIQAFAYCLYQKDKVLTDIAKSRLEAIKEFSSLGSGYQIALRDMEIRGVGNILGSEQHGHMVSIGFDLYCQLLNEAVDSLRGLETRDPELDTEIDINISAFIPNSYMEDERQKVIEYKRLANVRSFNELEYIKNEWVDRFGKYSEEVENLLKIVEIRLIASKTGIKQIKSEQSALNDCKNIKLEVNFRLEKWFELQKMLPRKMADRVSLKSSARGSTSNSSFLLVKTLGLNSKDQLNFMIELLSNLKSLATSEKIA